MKKETLSLKQMGKRGFFFSLLLFFVIFVLIPLPPEGHLRSQQETIASGEVAVKGLTLQVDPPEQTVPVNIPTAVSTVFSMESPQLIKGMVVKGELRGPGLSKPIVLTTLPNHPFSIPGLSVKGNYYLESIRLERGGTVLLKAEPERALIRVMDIVVTRVKTEPLTLEQIYEKGIKITEENFTVFNFSVGIMVESTEYRYEFPVVYSGGGPYIPPVVGRGGSNTGSGGLSDWKQIVPFNLEYPESDLEMRDVEMKGEGNKLTGVLIFNNDIAFLHQFFSVMFILGNAAPDGSSISLKDVRATITYPDGLREAETTPPHIIGTPIPVRCPGPDEKLGTSDDLDIILASFSGMAEFLAEGLKKGTHFLTVHFNGTLTGLPTGDVPIEGTASGAVVVRDPEFSITFSHPDVIREGEEYDIFVTMTNTSSVPANLVSLTMPAAQLIGTRLMTDVTPETVTFETIAPGDSSVAQFHMLSEETGEVRATAFKAGDGITGKFVLTAGVGEKGIPLSPDTLVLPGYVYELPPEIVKEAQLSLGEAYSIATTPAGGLPSHLPMVHGDAVKTRVLELMEAGQRVRYHETMLKSLQVLTLDWLGNRYPDLPFDILRRLTSKGKRFAAAIAAEFNGHLETTSPVLFQKSFVETCSYKNPFFSAVLSFPAGTRNARLLLKDYYKNELTREGEESSRDIPFGEMYLLEDGSQAPVDFALIGSPEEIAGIAGEGTKGYSYTVEVVGEETGNCDLSLIVPDGSGGFQQVSFAGIGCEAGSRSVVTVIVKMADESSGGTLTLDTALPHDVVPIEEPALQLIGAVQDCIVDNAGHAAALLFNRSVINDAGTLKSYFYPDKEGPHYFRDHFSSAGKKVYAAFLQTSERVVLVGLDNPISPFVESRIIVENMLDTDGNPMEASPVEMPIDATIRTPGGIVYGRVLTAGGLPVFDAGVRLEEDEGDGDIVRSYTRTDASGNYQFDFVRILDKPFRIVVTDISTGKSESIAGRLSVNGQRFNMDIFMKGRGAVGGVVLNGAGEPFPGAYVYASAGENGAYEYFSARCSEKGEFTIANLPLGAVNIRGVYGSLAGTVDTAISHDGELKKVTVTLLSGPIGKVNGRILENDGVTPVEGATMYIYHNNLPLNYVHYSDEAGFFEFATVPIGEFTIYSNRGPSVSGSVSAGQTASVVIIRRGTGTIEGIVKKYNGDAFPGILVYIPNTQFSATTDGEGRFSIANVYVGTYTIIAFDPETYQQVTVNNVYLKYENSTVGTVVVFPAPPGKGAIIGTLRDYNNNPLGSTEMCLYDSAFKYIKTLQTDANGAYRVDDLTVGKYVLAAGLSDQAGVAGAAILRDADVATADIHCRGKGTLKINVWEKAYDENGQLIQTARVMADVEIRYSDFVVKPGEQVGFTGTVSNFVTDPSRALEVGPVFTGFYSVFAKNFFHPYGAYASGTLTTPGEIDDVDLYLNPTGSVKITVKDYDGTLLGGAPVAFKVGSDVRQAQTLADGTFTFSIVPPGNFSIEAKHPGTSVVRKNEKDGYMGFEGQQMELEVLLKGTGTVRVHVTDASGNIVPNANVTFRYIGYPHEKKEAVCGSEGTCDFVDILTGKFAIEAYDSTGTGGRSGGTLQFHGDLVEVTVRLDPTGTVTGKVLAPDNETPVSNAQVKLFSNGAAEPLGYVTTGTGGLFQFEHVPFGSYRLEAYEPFTGRKGHADGTISGVETKETDVRLEGRGSVSGTFYDGSGVTALANAAVVLKSGNSTESERTTTTDSPGNYRFELVPEGNFTVSAKDPITQLWGEAEGTIAYDEQEVVVDIFGQESGTVEVLVFEADGVTPVTGASVSVEGKSSTPEYVDGKYVFNYIAKGGFTVIAGKNGDGGRASGEIRFHGQTAAVTIVFHGFGTVTGMVTDADDVPLAGISVTLKSGGYSLASAVTTTETDINIGNFSFTNVPPGAFTVEAKDVVTNEGASVDGNLEAFDTTASVTLKFRPVGTVGGSVLNADGVTAAENAYVTLKGVGFSRSALTGADGSFLFKTVELESFTVEVQGYGGTGLAKSSGVLSTGTRDVNLGTLILDNTRPEVTGIIPADGTLGVTVGTSVTVTFSEEMDTASLNSSNIKVIGGGTAAACGIQPAADGKSVVLTPTLQNFVLYAVTLDENTRDASGNTMGKPFSATFTTADTVGPSVVSITPLNHAVEVPVQPVPVITVTFSEPIDTTQFDTQNNITLSRGGSGVAGSVQFGGNNMTVLFTPSQLESDSTYTVTVQGVKDMAGNSQAQSFTSVFSTLDTISPALSLTPGGATTVVEGSSVTVTADTGSAVDIAAVYFFINGELKFTDISSPYIYQFKTPLISQVGGNFLVDAYAVDRAGNQSNRPGITYYLLNDGPPEVTLTGPANTDVWPGSTVSFIVDASDDRGMTEIVLTAVGGAVNVVKNRSVSGQSCSEPFNISIPTHTLPNTEITVNAEAVDNAGHRAAAPSVILNVPDDQQAPTAVFNTPGSYESFGYNSVIPISVTLTDDVGINIDDAVKRPVISISYNGLQGDGALETTTAKVVNNYIASASYTVPQLIEDTEATITITAEDLSGKPVTAGINVYLTRHVDEDAPVVSLITPTGGTLVYPGEPLPVWVTAADASSGIERVEFFLDDASTPFDTVTTPESGTTDLYKAVYPVPVDAAAGSSFTIKAVAWENKVVDPKSSFISTVCEVVSGDIRYIDVNTTIDDQNYALYQDRTLVVKGSGTTLTINSTGQFTFQHVLVKDTGVLTHGDATVTDIERLEIKTSGKVVVGPEAQVKVNGKGCLGGYSGANADSRGRTYNNDVQDGSDTSSGGSYGGLGGKYNNYNVNPVYGSIYDPVDPGSGGGGLSGSYYGGDGGGVIRIDSPEMIVDGSITANGINSVGRGNAGAGSGGSIRLDVITLKGSGQVTANGGTSGSGGSGGGGRIALYYSNAAYFDLDHIRAEGGDAESISGESIRKGSAGTVYLKKNDQDGKVLISQNDNGTTNATPLTGALEGWVTGLTENVLTDTNAAFMPGSLVGMVLVPNIERSETFSISANTDTTITVVVPGALNLTDVTAVGKQYRVKHPADILLQDGTTHISGYAAAPAVTLDHAELILDGTLTVDSLSLQNGSKLTHSPAAAAAVYSLYVKAGEIIIDSASAIDVSSRGYLGGYQVGNDGNIYGLTYDGDGQANGSKGFAAGSYGGYGGNGWYTFGNSTYTAGKIYGSFTNPSLPGSGGGGTPSNPPGGSGGGVIRLEASSILLDGDIIAGGGSANSYAGSGSGGSIHIDVTTLQGQGMIMANGGNSIGSTGGGGGRIAVYYQNADEFDLETNITAYGGRYTNGTDTSRNGGPGTVYLKKQLEGEVGRLVIKNDGNKCHNPLAFPVIKPSTITRIEAVGSVNCVLVDENTGIDYMPGSLVGMKLVPDVREPGTTFTIVANGHNSITVDGDLTAAGAGAGDTYKGILVFDERLEITGAFAEFDRDVELGTLVISGNGSLSHPVTAAGSSSYSYLSITAGSITVDSGSSIDVTGRGYLGGYMGDNAGVGGMTFGNTTTGGSGQMSGASLGGLGGRNSSSPVNAVYGSLYEPFIPGSGGGAYTTSDKGGNGGGVIRLMVDQLTLNGSIYSDGGVSTIYGGCGSGGSIRIDVQTLSGSGNIRAVGGGGKERGAGGGGRIAVYYENVSAFDLTNNIDAHGGDSNNTNIMYNAGAGTIFLKDKTTPTAPGDLVIDNKDIPTWNAGTGNVEYTTPLPGVGAGNNTLLEANRLVDSTALFKPGSLAGLKLNPQSAGTTVFTILSNTGTEIFTDPADGDMTLTGTTNSAYIGEHHLFSLTIKGLARVQTSDRIIVDLSRLTVDTGSALDKAQ